MKITYEESDIFPGRRFYGAKASLLLVEEVKADGPSGRFALVADMKHSTRFMDKAEVVKIINEQGVSHIRPINRIKAVKR